MVSNTDSKREEPFGKFGRYVVLKLIGKGGMGKVYLAEDPVLERKLAVKVITVESTLDEQRREEYLKRFLLEARASAKLNHQSIVAVFDAGEEKGLPWIAFEFVDGERLTDLIKRKGKLPIEKAIRTIWPFYLAIFLALMLITYVPIISLGLPNWILP